MKFVPFVSFMLLLPGLALAQGTMSCVATTGVPPSVRAGGKTELAGDMTVTCSGGTPTAANAPVPQYTLRIQSKSILLGFDSTGQITNEGLAPVNITSRQLTSDGWSEAILMIDEPHSTAKPSVPLLACGDVSAPAIAGVCGMTGTGTGLNAYAGSAGRPNVFQGQQVAADTMQWSGIPIDPPPAGQTRIIRITNVRVNANQAPLSSTLIPAIVLFYPSLNSTAGSVPLATDSDMPETSLSLGGVTGASPAAFIQQELTAATKPPLGALVLPECQSRNSSLLSNPAGTANSTLSIAIQEGFQSAFRRKNWATNGIDATVYPAGGDQNQNILGAVYNTESGLENLGPSHDPNPNPPLGFIYPQTTVSATVAFPSTNGLVNAGVADQGFRIALLFHSVPSGVALYVPTAIRTSHGQAVLVSTDSSGAGAFSAVASTGGSIGDFSNTSGLAEVQISNGSGLAVYEILYADPFSADPINVPIALSYLANQAATDVIATATVASAAVSGSDMADALSPVPRFGAGGVAGLGVPQQFFVFKSCSQPIPGLTLTSNAAALIPLGAPITFTATVAPPTSTGQVAFYVDKSPLAVSDIHAGVAVLTTTLPGIPAGSHEITGVYTTPAPENLKIPATTQISSTSLTGYVDQVSCQTVSGWAADRNSLNSSISVDIRSDTQFLGTVVANLSRPDVGSFLGDNGLHGFSFTLPPGVANVRVSFHGWNIVLGGSPQAVPCATQPRYRGYVDSASCSGITGWVADQNRPGQSINVSLWISGFEGNSFLAKGSRTDVGTVLGDNGLHGFFIPISSSWADGVTKVVLHFESSASTVGVAITLDCATHVAVYAGWVDSASCSGVSGWAADKNYLDTPITVSLWDGTNKIATVTADGFRPDVGALIVDNGLHGFTIPIPPAYANGLNHALQVHYESSAVPLGSPFTLNCGTPGSGPKYTGWVDSASCSGISGWAADKSRLNTPITVSLWDGATQIAMTTANASRPDVGTVVGDNGLHGFSIAPPSSYLNGIGHTFQVKHESSDVSLNGSPVSLTCDPPGTVRPNYAGWVDAVSCSNISGWAADRNSLNNSIFVNIYDGSTLLGTLSANGSRSDLGAYLSDNGLHAFSLATPASLKDGNAHTITVRPGGSSTALGGSQSLTCH